MDRRKFFKTASILVAAAGTHCLPAGGNELFYNVIQTESLNHYNKKRMKHKCKITVLKRECYKNLQAEYLADPQSGPCPYFHEGQEIIVDSDNFFRMLNRRILFGSMGLHQPVCLCCLARRLDYAWLDKRRESHDNLL